MRIYTASTKGVEFATAKAVTARNNKKYYAITHGEQGRGRWEYRIPLGARDYPYINGVDELILSDDDYKLIDIKKKDPAGNDLYIIGKQDVPDNRALLLLWLSPGYRGGATYTVDGACKVIAEGRQAQGIAGKMGWAPCPVIYADGECEIRWHRTGRLYGDDADWVIKWDGAMWTVSTATDDDLEDAIFG